MATRSRLGNTAASSLLKTAQASYERTQTYNDSIASYEFELSAKTKDDFDKYAAHLNGRINTLNSSDPSKALSLQKTLTTAYRSFNSAEISRASMDVNYGNLDDTGKYNKMYGLLQAAYANGDYSLGQSIESQMSSLSIKIQNEQQAAADRATAAGKKAATTATAAFTTHLNDVENRLDRAYQTGQPVDLGDGGPPKMLNATDYAVNRASILNARHDLLSQQAADDPRAADNLSQLEKSSEYRTLIDSGLVQFSPDGHPIVSPEASNLAVQFKRDSKTGVISRDYIAPDMVNGASQNGLVKAADDNGNKKQLFVAKRQLNDTTVDPSLKARVAYDVNSFSGADGKPVTGVGSYNDLISGNQVLVQTQGDNKGARAVAYGPTKNSKTGKVTSRTPEQAAQDLQNLADPTVYHDGVGADIGYALQYGGGDAVNALHAEEVVKALKKNGVKEALHAASAGAGGIPVVGGALNAIGRGYDLFTQRKKAADAAAAAAAARQASIAAQQAQDQARVRQLQAAPPPAAKPSILWRPPAQTLTPHDLFLQGSGGSTAPAAVAKGIATAFTNGGSSKYNYDSIIKGLK